MLLLALWLAAQGAPSAADLSPEAAAAVAQADLFWRKGWRDDAWAELVRALEMPSGKASWSLHRQATDWAVARQDLDAALRLARAAERLSANADQRAASAAATVALEQGFGVVVVTGPEPGLTTRFVLERAGPVFNPTHKAWIEGAKASTAQRQVLPVRLGLPAGDYTLNGAPVTVTPGQDTSVQLAYSQLGPAGTRRLQASRLELEGGVATWFGDGALGLGSLGFTQLSALVPVGPLLLGPTALVGRQAWTPPVGSATHSAAWSVGGRVLWETPLGLSPLVLRVGGGARLGTVPGIALDCSADGRCALAQEGSTPPVAVRATARPWLPGAELSLLARQPGRERALSAGVTVGWEAAVGGLSGGRATTEGSGAPVDWTASDVALGLQGLRMSAGVSLAL